MNISQRLKDVAISDSGFIFDPVTGLTFSVNQTGRFMLERLRDGLDGEGVVDSLKDSFDVNARDDLTRDLKEFVRILREQGILPRDAQI